MRSLQTLLTAILGVGLLPLSAHAQAATAPAPAAAQDGVPVPAKEQLSLLTAAHQQYYNLQAHGVKSYECDVDFDWPGFLAVAAGKPVPASDPILTYLQASHMHFVSDLSGPAEVTWSKSGPAPEGKGEVAETLRASLKQMLNGYFQAWTPSLNGTLYPLEADSMVKTGQGYRLRGKEGEQSVEETLSPALLLKSIAITGGGGPDNTMDLTFTGEPKSLLLASAGGQYRQTPEGPAMPVEMKSSFQTTDGVSIPSALVVSLPGVTNFTFKFVGCTVQKTGGK